MSVDLVLVLVFFLFCFVFRWKERIDKAKTNAPFNKWAVACFLKDDEKAKALMR